MWSEEIESKLIFANLVKIIGIKIHNYKNAAVCCNNATVHTHTSKQKFAEHLRSFPRQTHQPDSSSQRNQTHIIQSQSDKRLVS